MAEPRKINWTTVAAVVAAITGIIALIFTALTYFQSSPYQLEATGRYANIHLPSGVLDISAVEVQPLTEKRIEQPEVISKLASQFLDIVRYRHSFIFTLKNEGNKEVQNIKLLVPGAGVYEVLRTSPINKTERFSNEIPVGNLSPSDELTVLVWTDNERARNETERMRFVHPDGVVSVRFTAPREPSIIDTTFNALTAIALIIMSVTVFRLRKYIPVLFRMDELAKNMKELKSQVDTETKDKAPTE